MIESFQKFNESRRNDTDYSALADIARTVIVKLFGSYEQGRYEEDAYYNYGETVKWSNGVEETGYITDIYRIKIRKEWLLMKYLPKEHLKKYFAIIDRKLPHSQNAMDCASIVVTRNEGISSRRKELYTIRIWAGEEKFAQIYADVNISKGFNSSKLRELEKAFKESAAKITDTDLIKSIFNDWIQTNKMIKTYKNNPNNFDLRKFNKHFNPAWKNSKKLNKFNDMTGIFNTKEEPDYMKSLFAELRDNAGRATNSAICFTFFKYFKEYKDGIIYSNYHR